MNLIDCRSSTCIDDGEVPIAAEAIEVEPGDAAKPVDRVGDVGQRGPPFGDGVLHGALEDRDQQVVLAAEIEVDGAGGDARDAGDVGDLGLEVAVAGEHLDCRAQDGVALVGRPAAALTAARRLAEAAGMAMNEWSFSGRPAVKRYPSRHPSARARTRASVAHMTSLRCYARPLVLGMALVPLIVATFTACSPGSDAAHGHLDGGKRRPGQPMVRSCRSARQRRDARTGDRQSGTPEGGGLRGRALQAGRPPARRQQRLSPAGRLPLPQDRRVAVQPGSRQGGQAGAGRPR